MVDPSVANEQWKHGFETGVREAAKWLRTALDQPTMADDILRAFGLEADKGET